MYSVVLLTAMATTTATPGFWHGHDYGGYGWYRGGYGHGCYGCYGCYGGWGYDGYSGYAPYSSYSGYDGYGCYGGFGFGCYGCYGCGGFMPHYGCYGAGYGYHGGCYGAGGGIVPYNQWYASPYMWGGCFGCHGGQSGYGVPLPTPPETRPDAFKPVKKPVTAPDKEKEPEEIVVPKVKKLDDKKPEDKKVPGEEQVRVKVRIDIPEGARLFVDGQPIRATGSRLFQTPPLSPGQKYFYTIRVELERDGQMVEELRRVIVEPGIDVAVSFPNLSRERATAQAQD